MDMQPPSHITDRLLGRSSRSDSSLTTSSMIRTGIWSVCYFAFYLAQQIAELLAPLLLILGVGWYILPHIVNAITTSAATADPQARDIMNHVAGTLPNHLQIGSHLITPGSLIFDGILLMAIAAIGATVSALAARNM
ncbi:MULTISPECIES: hypothetical protein [Gluconobacter]|uniref:Uncharacterized protein n=5 Tax=Gluconobacter TaxID=441 RepID=Q5FU92_GLUOX|nr:MULTISPECIES: hypothetical protein [Gluconobacter]AAW60054.1 Hypothetical protein GOX0271 [Gluconobacter oxydans 621H]AHK70209.1 hypothetical protein GLS_c02920 [Gluconobacter oxydans DSM 3504]KXV01798.1 hypothetical protein AD929_04920 [Gluconobacter potus]KXV07656.1 hypothetical protein AD931_09345 [Gluconobacter oxydans]KXV12024.1 hypothetical protein AD932_08850 [Gluconobacter oxydans]